MNKSDLEYSDYIIYVDESGDHSLAFINPRYPIFVLSLCIFKKSKYTQHISTALRMLKFSNFGHDMIIFHEQEIRKKTGAFSKLGQIQREQLMNDLSELMDKSEFLVIPIVIDKVVLQKQKSEMFIAVYHLAMQCGLESVYAFLKANNQQTKKTHIIFEARGRVEDADLELEFKKVCNGQNSFQELLPFEIIIADKKVNSCGLQFADLVARPIGLSALKPEQANRAFDIVQKKIYQKPETCMLSFFIPIKAKGLEVALEAQTPVG